MTTPYLKYLFGNHIWLGFGLFYFNIFKYFKIEIFSYKQEMLSAWQKYTNPENNI